MNLGARLGPYEIVSHLGAGGMGEVYRARDTRLERTVAIKILPPHLSRDETLRSRFEREARAIASLSHPNICTLYDVGRQDHIDFLVMEFLDGETLADRLRKGRLPSEQALACAVQIADALDRAHRSGIVHRDLKPGNIMLTKSGIKLLDFGLAKLVQDRRPGRDSDSGKATQFVSGSPGGTGDLTQEGTILGTLQYMAPEQLEGEEADTRTDIFAFGLVLYEMLTGQKAFTGKTQASLIAAILERDPEPLSRLLPLTPPALERIVKKCLAKDREARWQSARDLSDDLRWVAGAGSETGAAEAQGARPRNRAVGWLTASVLALVLVISLGIYFLTTPQRREAGVSRFSIPVELPKHVGLDSVAISPDGRRIAFATRDSEANRVTLWIRELDSLQPRVLQEEGSSPFWSPDSRFVAFCAEKKLKKLNLAGGPPQVICDAPEVFGGSWNEAGVILFALGGTNGIAQVPAAGGQPKPVTVLRTNGVDQSRSDRAHRFPRFLPDGRHFLFLAQARLGDFSELCVGSLDGTPLQSIMKSRSQAAYVRPGYLLFWTQGSLLAQPFDTRSLRPSGEPRLIAENVNSFLPRGEAKFSVSDSGTLIYCNDGGANDPQLVRVDRAGRELDRFPVRAQDGMFNPWLSRDEQRLVLHREARGTSEIWLADSRGGAATRLTTGQGNDWYPLWSPDQTTVYFASNRGGQFHLYRKPASGMADEEMVWRNDDPVWRLLVPNDVSPDGRFLLFYRSEPGDAPWRLWVLPLDGNSNPTPLRKIAAGEGRGVFSPDGRWIAYTSDESGSSQVYVQAFPNAERKWRVSETKGFHPRWNPNGKELFYVMAHAGVKKLMAVEVTAGTTFEHGPPKALFDLDVWHTEMRAQYNVGSNGQHFLIYGSVRQTNAPPSYPMTAVLNWTAMLPR